MHPDEDNIVDSDFERLVRAYDRACQDAFDAKRNGHPVEAARFQQEIRLLAAAIRRERPEAIR